MSPDRLRPAPTAARGSALVDALIALLVLAASVAGAARFGLALRLHADAIRERSTAVVLAQSALEDMRYAMARHASGANPQLPAIQSSRIPASSTSFEVTSSARPGHQPGLAHAVITVQWTDRLDASHRLELISEDAR